MLSWLGNHLASIIAAVGAIGTLIAAVRAGGKLNTIHVLVNSNLENVKAQVAELKAKLAESEKINEGQ